MNKTQLKTWKTDGMATVTRTLIAECTARGNRATDAAASEERRAAIAAAIAAAGDAAAAAELLCPVLDGVRDYLYTDIDKGNKAEVKTTGNKLTAARRLCERAVEASFPDSEITWQLRRKNGAGATFQAQPAPEKKGADERLLASIQRRFPDIAAAVIAEQFTAWVGDNAAAAANKEEQRRLDALATREAQREALKDVINSFSETAADVAKRRNIDTMTAATMLAEFGQVEPGIFDLWLDTQKAA